MKHYEPRICVVCGKEYTPKRSDQKTCLSEKCKKEVMRMSQAEYRRVNYAKVLETNRRSMAKRKEERRRMMHPTKPDTIVAIGYADRQRANTLAMVGKVRTEL